MSFYENFVSNLDAAIIQSDVTGPLNLEPVSGKDILSGNNEALKMRVRRLHELFYLNAGTNPQVQILHLKTLLKENFPGIFIRKSSYFKSLASEVKFIELVHLLVEHKQLDLLKHFTNSYTDTLIKPKLNYIFVNLITKLANDEHITLAFEKIIELYKLNDLSEYKNVLDLARFKNYNNTATFLQKKMGLNLSSFNAYDLIFKFLCVPSLEETDRMEASKELKVKIKEVPLNEWEFIISSLLSGESDTLTHFKADGMNFVAFCEAQGIKLFEMKNNSNRVIASCFMRSWDFLKHFPVELSKEQIFNFSVAISNYSALGKKSQSIVAVIKDYLEVTNSENKVIDCIPEFPILWWGCGKDKKKYAQVSFWKGLEYCPELASYLNEGKAQNLAHSFFGEKGPFYTKLISETLNDGAASGEINWEKLAYLKELNTVLANRDDFQVACSQLALSDKDYQNYLHFFAYQKISGLEFLEVIKKLNKETKMKLFTHKADTGIIVDSLAMIKRLSIMRVNIQPGAEVLTWKHYHDFLVAENSKIKTKGIKLNQEFLKPFLHDKIVAGYKVHIPLFSEDFVWAGDTLGICVGSAGYDKKVASKGSNIMFLLEGDKVRYVIEFTHKGVIQAKGRENSEMPGVQGVLIKAFLKENWWTHPKRTFENSNDGYDYYDDGDDFQDDYEEEEDDDIF